MNLANFNLIQPDAFAAALPPSLTEPATSERGVFTNCTTLRDVLESAVLCVAKEFRNSVSILVPAGESQIEIYSFEYSRGSRNDRVNRKFIARKFDDHRNECLNVVLAGQLEIAPEFSDGMQLLKQGIQAIWCAPVALPQQQRATIVVYQNTRTAFDQRKIRRLKEIAGDASKAIHKVAGVLDRRTEPQFSYAVQLEALNQVGHRLAMADTRDEVFNIIAEAATEVLKADLVSYVVPNIDVGRCFVLSLDGKKAIPQNGRFPLAGSSIELTMIRGKTIAFDFTSSRHSEHQKLAEQGLRSGITTPIRSKNKIVGLLSVSATNMFQPAEEAKNLFSALGRFMESALERIQAQEILATTMKQLVFEANHDELTGLPNRSHFVEALTNQINKCKRNGKSFAVIFIDLDDFKKVNDSFGHHVGDSLLTEVADRMRNELSSQDTVGRLGGDEFVILLRNVTTSETACGLAEQLLHSVSQPYKIAEQEIVIGASAGLSMFPNHGETSAALMSHSDIAMYAAKQNGKNNCQTFTKQMAESIQHRLVLQADLEKALLEDQFFLEFQPQFDLPSGHIIAVETLLRWRHPDRGVIYPDSFIEFAEESRLISRITEQVIEKSVAAVKELRNYSPNIYASINISAVDFESIKILMSQIERSLTAHDSSGDAIELELTERVFLECSDAACKAIDVWKAQGIRIAIDDFGTGFSSLRYLLNLPIDTLKIDQSFIRSIEKHPKQLEIVRSILLMSRAIGAECIAEGVENKAELNCIQEIGCPKYQGYFGARPMSMQAITELLNNK